MPCRMSASPDALLERIRGRAAGYDRDNAFFHEDLAELADAGYLKIFVPASDGGLGLGLAAAAQLPAAAGDGGAGHRAGDQHAPGLDRRRARPGRPGRPSLDFVLREAGRRARSSRSGTPRPATTRSSSIPERRPSRWPDGGYCFTGPQDLHQPLAGVDPAGDLRQGPLAADGDGQLVHGFLTAGDSRVRESWTTGTRWACAPASPTPRCWTAPWSRRTGSSANCRSARTRTR